MQWNLLMLIKICLNSKMIKLLSKEEFFSILHDQLTLNQIHRFLRDNKSPLQLDL